MSKEARPTNQEQLADEFRRFYSPEEEESFGAIQALSYLVVLGSAFMGKAVRDGVRWTRAKIHQLTGRN
ncbi:MAG: hypothetical protein UV80_C0002G0047 [Candidatus Peregrinibacteria bacterium GW2011_GWF2_43_17]|nr:MAG: hypothetical protein UV80_C0002G0047 [Candidatus Peregrinibacteria bacterium GW2011_GWF2_43_17]HAU39906.1 hypothetical protein [Candidatus Peregrinibacteria bacterium]